MHTGQESSCFDTRTLLGYTMAMVVVMAMAAAASDGRPVFMTTYLLRYMLFIVGQYTLNRILTHS